MNSATLLNVADYARAARAQVAAESLDYFEGGALDEITLRENTEGWSRLKLYYRVLAGVGARDLRTTVLGQPISMPIVVAPTAFHRLACDQGEMASARGGGGGRGLFFLRPPFPPPFFSPPP
ncbi:MAG: alpha-hydroxy-acid oxidizing protein, partial [Chthoniobacterales bacterium]